MAPPPDGVGQQAALRKLRREAASLAPDQAAGTPAAETLGSGR